MSSVFGNVTATVAGPPGRVRQTRARAAAQRAARRRARSTKFGIREMSNHPRRCSHAHGFGRGIRPTRCGRSICHAPALAGLASRAAGSSSSATSVAAARSPPVGGRRQGAPRDDAGETRPAGDAVDADEAHRSEDEREDSCRRAGAAQVTAGGDGAAVAHRPEQVRERGVADRVDGAGSPCSLKGGRDSVDSSSRGNTPTAPRAISACPLAGLSGRCPHLVAAAREDRDRRAPDTAGGAGDEDRTIR